MSAFESLHVAFVDGKPTVWTHDGEHPIAICADTATAHRFAAVPDLRNALAGLVGLVQLIASRRDLPPGTAETLKTNHRFVEALRVLEAIDAVNA